MTPNSVVSSPNHEDLIYPSPPTSPFIREPSSLRKKVVVVIQSTISSETVSSTVVESNISPLTNVGVNLSSNTYESVSSEYGSDPESYSSSSAASAQKAKGRKLRRLTCPICKRKFVRRGTYKLHQYRKHGLLPIACEEEGCKERFATLSALFKHRAIHDPNSRYPCLNCSRVFTTIHAFKVHSRIHSTSIFKCDECGLNFKRITAYRRHMKSRHPRGAPRAKGKPVVLSKEEIAKMDATLSRLRAIVPKPPSSGQSGTARKLPIARLSSASTPAAAATMPPTAPPLEGLNPIADTAQSPTQLVNTIPVATFIPVYCAQPLAVGNEQVLPHVYTIASSDVAPAANALPGSAYDNAYHADSSIYVQATEQFADNDSFPVGLDGSFAMAPVEIVDLNACSEACGEPTNLPSFTWSNADDGLYPDSAVDVDPQRYRPTWLQPISLFTDHPDTQGGGEMPAVSEVFPSTADVNL